MKLIVEMDMPRCCADCPLLDERGDYPMCIATQETRGYNFDTRNKKMDKCPINGVLPDEHGDLIDRDALLEKHNMKSTSIEECLFDPTTARAFEKYCIIADAVETAETVVAAERKDDENH